jgi:hypothetical protein
MASAACVLFLDLLGFADLVEQASDIESFKRRGAIEPSEVFLKQHALTSKSDAASLFLQFHEILGRKIDVYTKHGITAITFSDSAFIHFPTSYHVIAFSASLMRALILARVPVRMGIGAGSFRVLRFDSEDFGKGHVHTAQFLGTAVVNAYRAERCGLTGMRIFLHPTMRKIAREQADVRTLYLAETNADTYAEVNYVFIRDMKRRVSTAEQLSSRHRQLKEAVAAMREGAPASKKHYYDNTRRALNRMFNDLKA